MANVRMDITPPEELARQQELESLLEEDYKAEKKRPFSWRRSSNQQAWRGGMIIKRGEIYLAALDPVVGREISKTRPVIYPFEVLLPKGSGNLPKASKVVTDQIWTLDKSRMISPIGRLGDTELRSVEKAIKIHLGSS